MWRLVHRAGATRCCWQRLNKGRCTQLRRSGAQRLAGAFSAPEPSVGPPEPANSRACVSAKRRPCQLSCKVTVPDAHCMQACCGCALSYPWPLPACPTALTHPPDPYPTTHPAYLYLKLRHDTRTQRKKHQHNVPKRREPCSLHSIGATCAAGVSAWANPVLVCDRRAAMCLAPRIQLSD